MSPLEPPRQLYRAVELQPGSGSARGVAARSTMSGGCAGAAPCSPSPTCSPRRLSGAGGWWDISARYGAVGTARGAR